MKCDKKSMLLYAVTDRTWLDGRTLAEVVEDTVNSGATFLQLREKDMDYVDFLAEAVKIKEITDRYNIPFVINDNIEVALASNADGVHVGQGDMSVSKARWAIGPDKILGVSAQTVEQAIKAEREGADYLGVGAVFSTSTKLDADYVPFETLRDICKAVSIPVVAIGGISEVNLLQLKGGGIDGVAVVSAIFAKKDIRQATKDLRVLAEKLVEA